MRILAAVDLADHGAAIAAQAAVWAADLGAKLDLAFVEQALVIAPYVRDPQVLELLLAEQRQLTESLRGRLEEMVADVPEAVRGQGRFLRGQAADALLEVADEYDLLVVGTHGRKGFSHFWLGSVAEKVVRGAPGAVLVVRLEAKKAGGLTPA